ncbi:prolyl oligopeptidase family serine peptidase [Phenylobacterium sp. J426]|uniref:alpha/beta hydrolase family protein n=1 Tax=Phenylobacterium sp. J426 TaxID=2898439 RepID=UPI0021512F61|nr:prolyl oligopeptidase family serine peptidase [Phenylobacterium sp. J426]MCR5875355.1 prolyl oligopeptidase family serine peptidase [Phenylobacterium sp. J426]
MYRKLLGVALAAGVNTAAQAQAPSAPPLEAFARLPAVTEAKIAPGGQRIAILGGAPTDRTIAFTAIDQPGMNILKLGAVETLGVSWAGDDYALARVAFWEKVGARADYRLVRTASVTPQAKFMGYLLGGDALSSQLTNQGVVGIVKGPPPRVMVRGLALAAGPDRDMNTRLGRKGENGDLRVPALFSVDPATGRGTQVERGDFDIEGWEVDLSGQARVMYKVDENTRKRTLYARPKGQGTWRMIQDGDDGRTFLGYSDADQSFYFASTGPGGTQVTRQRLPDGPVETVGKPVQGAGVHLVWDGHRNAVVGVAASGAERGIEWLDPVFAGAQATVSRAFKGRSARLTSWSEDLTRFIVVAEGPDNPAQWFLYDRARKEVSPIGDGYPELAEVTLGTTSFMRYRARDGLEIPAYLTLPPGLKAGEKPPLIVLPHGGPSAHDDPGFDYLTHFLASRGYAVLRPQYRGSTGFGPEFQKAGKGEWGGKMQTDLLDGVAAVADRADPARACIVGASFGGYAALYGAVFQPGAYRCAASINGVSDLGALIGDYATDFGRDNKGFELLREEVRQASPQGLDGVSPLKNAARASMPVLLVHGDKDTTVAPNHSQRMAVALKNAGKPVEHVVLAGENHYLGTTAARTQMLSALDAFLAKNLPVNAPQRP